MGAVLWLPAQYWPEAEGEKEDRRKAKRKRTLNTALHRPWYSTPDGYRVGSVRPTGYTSDGDVQFSRNRYEEVREALVNVYGCITIVHEHIRRSELHWVGWSLHRLETRMDSCRRTPPREADHTSLQP
jgi:hypothetical protein